MSSNGFANKNGIDKLTGDQNVLFDSDFKKMIAESEQKCQNLTLVGIDVDNFMRVNDSFGYQVGDEVLKEISGVLLEIERPHTLYLYSGDHFTVLFPDTEKEQAFLLMEEARKKIAQSPQCSRTSSTVSMGIATYPEDGSRDVDIFRKADGALYRAKMSGRNKIALAKEEKLVTKTAHYTTEQLKRLEALSGETGISEAALLREALDELLKKYTKAKDNARKMERDPIVSLLLEQIPDEPLDFGTTPALTIFPSQG